MNRMSHVCAALLMVATLAGCGAQALPVAPMAASANGSVFDAMSVVSDSTVQSMITSYQKISGYSATAMSERANLINQLGNTDSDRAVSFLESQYSSLGSYPASAQQPAENAIVTALADLDTYQPAVDDPTLAAGPGNTPTQQQAYADAVTRHKRHSGLGYWIQHPFKFVGTELIKLGKVLGGRGGSSSKRHRHPSPAPSPAPDPGPGPSGPSGPGGDPSGGPGGDPTGGAGGPGGMPGDGSF